MLTLGDPAVSVSDDDWWTVKTEDGGAAVHFEHTVALTENGVEVLTEGVGEPLER
jgi:methionyl aminopeptidase